LSALTQYAANIKISHSIADIVAHIKQEIPGGGHFVLMSNGSFGGIYGLLKQELG
jgi:UDP-N-acetylmuramate: L-alanyl-gamma-D-glutamyl-meso-diaminopimelate ligase